MPIERFALPAAVLGLAAGILASDFGIRAETPVFLVLGVAGGAVAAIGGRGSALRGGVLVLGVAIGFAAIGSWRHATTEGPDASRGPSVATLVDGNPHELTGTVADDPRPREDRVQLILESLTAVKDERSIAFGDRLLVWMPRGIDARAGDRVTVTTEVELAEDFDGFAYREYLARQRIGAIGRARFGQVVEPGTGPAALLVSARRALLGGLNDIVPEPEAALGAGILLGVRASIAPEISDAFATAGLTHVVAVSGWNIAIVAALIAALARPLERRAGGRWTTAAVASASVAGYVVLTGASPSVVRAALMAAAMLVGRLGGTRAHAASALGLAALVMLLAAPAVLWDVGFQL